MTNQEMFEMIVSRDSKSRKYKNLRYDAESLELYSYDQIIAKWFNDTLAILDLPGYAEKDMLSTTTRNHVYRLQDKARNVKTVMVEPVFVNQCYEYGTYKYGYYAVFPDVDYFDAVIRPLTSTVTTPDVKFEKIYCLIPTGVCNEYLMPYKTYRTDYFAGGFTVTKNGRKWRITGSDSALAFDVDKLSDARQAIYLWNTYFNHNPRVVLFWLNTKQSHPLYEQTKNTLLMWIDEVIK